MTKFSGKKKASAKTETEKTSAKTETEKTIPKTEKNKNTPQPNIARGVASCKCRIQNCSWMTLEVWSWG